MKLFITLAISTLALIAQAQEEGGTVCSEQFCMDYTLKTPCPSLPTQCQGPEANSNGLFLPSPTICNCCPYCLAYIKEGGYCPKGDLGVPMPSTICGPGLTCVDQICVKMPEACVQAQSNYEARKKNGTLKASEIAAPPVCSVLLTPCSQAQYDYDTRRKDGTLGSLESRPNCDADGIFEPYQCIIGQTCFCVDENGKRLFGEIPYTKQAQYIQKCLCSRKYQKAVELLDRELHPNEHFLCLENGDYNPIQCINDNCMCVDAEDGALTFPKADNVKVTIISNKTLPCFDWKIHQEGKYYPQCALRFIEVLQEVEEKKTNDGYDDIFGYLYPSCSIDGKFASVQNDKNGKKVFCADPNGNQIGDYSVPEEQAAGMDCNCARSNLLIPKTKTERPKCCPNGNFDKVQCRRGTCLCVNPNGAQTTGEEFPEEEIESLTCFADRCKFV